MSKKLKKLRKKINKVLGEVLRDPDTTYGMAERICYNLHQEIEETYRNSFTKTGKLYVEKRIVSPRQPYEPLENGEIMSQDTMKGGNRKHKYYKPSKDRNPYGAWTKHKKRTISNI